MYSVSSAFPVTAIYLLDLRMLLMKGFSDCGLQFPKPEMVVLHVWV